MTATETHGELAHLVASGSDGSYVQFGNRDHAHVEGPDHTKNAKRVVIAYNNHESLVAALEELAQAAFATSALPVNHPAYAAARKALAAVRS